MKKVVIKIGSSIIAPGGKFDSKLVLRLIKDIIAAQEKGYKIIIVSSGAIALGLNALDSKRRPQDIHTLMAISSYGQIALMDIFNSKFKKYGHSCAQILLTWEDFEVRKRDMNIRATVDKLLSMNIIPVINENDAISCEEIRFGDNDSLSARVAVLAGAVSLIVLSDVEGLLDGEVLVKEVSQITPAISSLAKIEDKTHTSGGMFTKIEAAKIATLSGIKTIITCGRKSKVISRILAGESHGTLFLPSQKQEKARKKWIVSKKVKGKICIDEGAKKAVLNNGKSLLNVGIVGLEGNFKKGDTVIVCDKNGNTLGFGLTHYDCNKLKRSQKKKLVKEVIHRNNFTKV